MEHNKTNSQLKMAEAQGWVLRIIVTEFAGIAKHYQEKGLTLVQAQQDLIEKSPGFADDPIFQDVFPLIWLREKFSSEIE